MKTKRKSYQKMCGSDKGSPKRRDLRSGEYHLHELFFGAVTFFIFLAAATICQTVLAEVKRNWRCKILFSCAI
jgi:hypothetical protein